MSTTPDTIDLNAILDGDTAQKAEGRCVVKIILDDLPADIAGRERFIAAVESNDRYAVGHKSQKAIRAAFKRLDYTVSVHAIQEHRRHECRCYL